MAPIVAIVPAILAGLWSGLVGIAKWCVEHYHIVKIVIVCTLITMAFYFGRKAYIFFNDLLKEHLNQIAASTPTGPGAGVSILAKANYVLPVSEMFALLSVYLTFAALCLSLKFIIMGYKAIPFKNA